MLTPFFFVLAAHAATTWPENGAYAPAQNANTQFCGLFSIASATVSGNPGDATRNVLLAASIATDILTLDMTLVPESTGDKFEGVYSDAGVPSVCVVNISLAAGEYLDDATDIANRKVRATVSATKVSGACTCGANGEDSKTVDLFWVVTDSPTESPTLSPTQNGDTSSPTATPTATPTTTPPTPIYPASVDDGYKAKAYGLLGEWTVTPNIQINCPGLGALVTSVGSMMPDDIKTSIVALADGFGTVSFKNWDEAAKTIDLVLFEDQENNIALKIPLDVTTNENEGFDKGRPQFKVENFQVTLKDALGGDAVTSYVQDATISFDVDGVSRIWYRETDSTVEWEAKVTSTLAKVAGTPLKSLASCTEDAIEATIVSNFRQTPVINGVDPNTSDSPTKRPTTPPPTPKKTDKKNSGATGLGVSVIGLMMLVLGA